MPKFRGLWGNKTLRTITHRFVFSLTGASVHSISVIVLHFVFEVKTMLFPHLPLRRWSISFLWFVRSTSSCGRTPRGRQSPDGKKKQKKHEANNFVLYLRAIAIVYDVKYYLGQAEWFLPNWEGTIHSLKWGPCQKYYVRKLCTLGQGGVNFVHVLVMLCGLFVHIVVCYKSHTHNGVDS